MAKSYALTQITHQIKDDGVSCYVRLEIEKHETIVFHVSYEGMSRLNLTLMAASQEMARRLVESGQARKYNVQKRPINPFHALAAQAGHDPDTGERIVSIQTTEGPSIDIVFPLEQLRRLLESIAEDKPGSPAPPSGPRIQ